MKKQHCVVMDDELSQELKIVAIKMGMSMSDLISKSCVEYLRWRKELIDRGIIFEDVRDVKAALNARYGTESQRYVDTDNSEGL